MSRLYFHLQAGGQVVPDDEGTDLPDVSAAQREAMQSARELLADAIKSGKPEVAEAFVIRDAAGRALSVTPGRDALQAARPVQSSRREPAKREPSLRALCPYLRSPMACPILR